MKPRDMILELPVYYRESPEANAIVDGHTYADERFKASADDLLAQNFISTATWGLDAWERVYGIKVAPSKPIDERRYVLLARIRGSGVLTVSKLKEVAEAFYGGSVAVTEDSANYRITVKFNSNLGVPPNLGDVKAAIGELIPAHIAVEYAYSYLLIRDVSAMTLSGIEKQALNQFAGGS